MTAIVDLIERRYALVPHSDGDDRDHLLELAIRSIDEDDAEELFAFRIEEHQHDVECFESANANGGLYPCTGMGWNDLVVVIERTVEII